MNLESRLGRAERQVPQPRRAPVVPMPLNIVDFATNPKFLGIDLFPVQATILKVIAGEIDTLTDLDLEVIAGWEQGWELVEDRGRYRWRGSEGTPPGLLGRLRACHEAGREGPEEVAAVIGRRGSKGLMGAIAYAYLLYRLLASDGVTADGPVRRGKAIAVLVMGAKLDQARLNAYGDLKDLIEHSPAFAPFLGKCTVTSTSLLLPSQLRDGAMVSKTEGLLQVRAVAPPVRPARPRSEEDARLVLGRALWLHNGRLAEGKACRVRPTTSASSRSAMLTTKASPGSPRGAPARG